MEIKINIAAILKDKPQGTKLYDWLHNIDVELDTISTTDTETVVWCTNETNNNTTCHRGYSEFGTERGYPDGLQILFPSKEMRDWSKFAWKKGDVLVSKHGTKEVIFDGFDDDYYVTFKGKHALETIEGESEYKGETLEIEKQTEFKDGDIAFADYGNRQNVFVVSDKTDLSEGYSSFISLDLSSLTLSMGCRISFFKKDLCKLRLATEEEKKQFFSALEKEGKRWDSDKKAIVDLKPKVELKPFDKVLVRDFGSQAWQVSLFGYKDSDFYYCCNGCGWNQCIPYNEETAHLLGTTGEWKGGEG